MNGSPNWIATLNNISTMRMSRASVKCPPRKAIAKRLLHDTSLLIDKIAFELGFNSARPFNGAFKAV